MTGLTTGATNACTVRAIDKAGNEGDPYAINVATKEYVWDIYETNEIGVMQLEEIAKNVFGGVAKYTVTGFCSIFQLSPDNIEFVGNRNDIIKTNAIYITNSIGCYVLSYANVANINWWDNIPELAISKCVTILTGLNSRCTIIRKEYGASYVTGLHSYNNTLYGLRVNTYQLNEISINRVKGMKTGINVKSYRKGTYPANGEKNEKWYVLTNPD